MPLRSPLYLRVEKVRLGPFGADSALREHGLRLAQEGTAKAKKRAVVAVARKLAVLLLTLWKSREPYESFPTMA